MTVNRLIGKVDSEPNLARESMINSKNSHNKPTYFSIAHKKRPASGSNRMQAYAK
jgi:hypothetical protein